MRPRVEAEAKRGTIIGIKVDKATKAKIDYIASAAGDTTSTYLFNLITEHIDQYTRMTKINWKAEFESMASNKKNEQ